MAIRKRGAMFDLSLFDLRVLVNARLQLPSMLFGLVAVSVSMMVFALTAVACEGGGGPPTSPTKEELIGPGKNPGAKNVEKSECGKPVNCATGNESEEQTDVSIGGRGPRFRVVRG